MKKVMFLLLCLLLLPLYGCDEKIKPAASIEPPSNIYVGMSRTDFKELYPKDVCFYYWTSYAFFDDPDGNPVVVYFEGNTYSELVVGAIYAYDKNGINRTDEAFYSLEGGMLVQEIVSYVGKPDPITNPTETMVWRIGDNIEYRLQLGYLNGQQTDELYLWLMHRWEGDEHSYPIGSEPWYPEE